jgi:hypothetical protein
VHKLDHDHHSLSWLARDNATHTWRRIDIVVASEEVTKFHVAAIEREMVERAADAARADAKGLTLEHFYHRGPNGARAPNGDYLCRDNLCMVFPLNGSYNTFRWTVQGGGRDRTEMSEAWFVRQCAKLRRERNNDGDGELRQYAPENVHAITAEEMLAILGRPRIIKVTRELREEAIVEEWIRDDQVPRYLVVRPDRIEEDFDFWLSEEAFRQ